MIKLIIQIEETKKGVVVVADFREEHRCTKVEADYADIIETGFKAVMRRECQRLITSMEAIKPSAEFHDEMLARLGAKMVIPPEGPIKEE